MIIDAVSFAVSDHEGGFAALAVLCPAARYCSTISKGASSPIRHFVTLEEWRLVEQQIAAGLPSQPLSNDSPISSVLDDLLEVWRVQWLARTPVRIARPEDAGVALDQHLAASLEAYRSGSRFVQHRAS